MFEKYVSLSQFCIMIMTEKAIRKLLSRAVLAVGLLMAACTSSLAQVKFSASVNVHSVPVNQNFQVTFTVENGNAKSLTPPSFADFQVLNGPSTSQNMTIINGSVSQSVSYSYILRPKKEGSFKIGKASANIEGVNVESNEVSISVTGPVQQQAQQQRRDPFSDPFFGDDPFEQQAQQQPQMSNEDIQKEIKDNVFVRIVTDKNNVFIGEPVTATIKLYFRLGIGSVGMNKSPSFDGFWSQEVQMPKQPKQKVETINGQQFYEADIQQYNLYPQRAGNLQISPVELNMVVQAAVQKARRGFFDNFFGPRVQNVQYKAISNNVSVTVKDVPAAGKPADYNGAVGKFSYSVKISSKEGKTDEAITYSIRISGTGNLKTIDVPKPSLPDGFEVFDPKVKEEVANTPSGMTGSKQYDYLIIPHQPGEYKIPGTSFSYFEPSAGHFLTLTSPELTLKISGAPSQNPNAGVAATAKEDVASLHSDIRYIKTRATDLSKKSPSFFGSPGYTALIASPLLLFVGLIFLKRRNESLAADLVGAKRRRATRLAKKRLSVAEKHLAQNNRKLFYDEVSRALWGYLGDKLSIDQSQLSTDNVEEKLLTKSVKTETITRLKNLINSCELALYSPSGTGDEMKINYNTAVSLITDLEDEIK